MPVANFFAGNIDLCGGVRVAAKDEDGDGFADLVTGSGDTQVLFVFFGSDLALAGQYEPPPLGAAFRGARWRIGRLIYSGNETAPSDGAGRPSIKTVTSLVPEKVAWEYCRGRRWEMEEC